MALNLQYEFAYVDRPVIPVTLTTLDDRFSAPTEALIDTGAGVSLFDAERGLALNLDVLANVGDAAYSVIGIGGRLRRIPSWWMRVSVPVAEEGPDLALMIGFVPGLAKSVGNLLGRDFLTFFDLGVSHSVRTAYIGRAR